MKWVMTFGKKGKLSLRYVGPYEVLQRERKFSYQLKLASELASVHSVFHVSILKKCIDGSVSILPVEGKGVNEDPSSQEVLVEIVDLQVKKLRNKEVASIKVLCINHLVEGATWEAEADMKFPYPHLFPQISRQS